MRLNKSSIIAIAFVTLANCVSAADPLDLMLNGNKKICDEAYERELIFTRSRDNNDKEDRFQLLLNKNTVVMIDDFKSTKMKSRAWYIMAPDIEAISIPTLAEMPRLLLHGTPIKKQGQTAPTKDDCPPRVRLMDAATANGDVMGLGELFHPLQYVYEPFSVTDRYVSETRFRNFDLRRTSHPDYLSDIIRKYYVISSPTTSTIHLALKPDLGEKDGWHAQGVMYFADYIVLNNCARIKSVRKSAAFDPFSNKFPIPKDGNWIEASFTYTSDITWIPSAIVEKVLDSTGEKVLRELSTYRFEKNEVPAAGDVKNLIEDLLSETSSIDGKGIKQK